MAIETNKRIEEIEDQIHELYTELYGLKESNKSYWLVEFETGEYDMTSTIRLGFCTEVEAETEAKNVVKKYNAQYCGDYREISEEANSLYYEYEHLQQAIQFMSIGYPMKTEYKTISDAISCCMYNVKEKLKEVDPEFGGYLHMCIKK